MIVLYAFGIQFDAYTQEQIFDFLGSTLGKFSKTYLMNIKNIA